MYNIAYPDTRYLPYLSFSNAIADFVRKAFNEPSHFDMLKFTVLRSKNIWHDKIILITVVIDF